MLECANGEFVTGWDGCINQGSIRVRCPKDSFPCNDLRSNGVEFLCADNCRNYGGRKDCSNDSIIRFQTFIPVYSLFIYSYP